MDETQIQLATDVLARLVAYGTARDRATDSELRTITMNDDEALALLAFLNMLSPGGIWSSLGQ